VERRERVGVFVVGGGGGVGWNRIDLNGVEAGGIVLSGASPVSRVFLSVPEMRLQVAHLRVVLGARI